MFQQIINFFKNQGWEYTQIEHKNAAVLGIDGKNGKFQFFTEVIEDENKCIFFSICGANVPENKKLEMSELLTRLNFGKFLGNFEMDYEDGEVRYKTSLYYDNSTKTNQAIGKFIMTNIITMDISLVAIMKLIYSDITPLQAYEIVKDVEE
jgi:hypothetical protein